tara:strand:+ start:1256 stop:1546 length:291 start_codon:yes stop_codon:yes gene_type:complete
MVQRTGSRRRKTRSKLSKNVAEKGKIKIRNYLQNFKESDKVVLVAEPAVQGGMHHPRFQGLAGEIVNKQGSCYKVKIKDGNKEKMVVIHPIHLRKR